MNPLKPFAGALVGLLFSAALPAQRPSYDDFCRSLEHALDTVAPGVTRCLHGFIIIGGFQPAIYDVDPTPGCVPVRGSQAVAQQAALDGAQRGSLYVAVVEYDPVSGAPARTFAVPYLIVEAIETFRPPSLPLTANGNPAPGGVLQLQAPAVAVAGPATFLFGAGFGSSPLLPGAMLDPAGILGVAVEPAVGAGVSLPIPNDPTLSGYVFDVQAVQRMASPLVPLAVTDGMQVVVQ